MPTRYPGAYLETRAMAIPYREVADRINDYHQIYQDSWQPDELSSQARRCMDCGVPTCMSACPLGNLIPDWNHLVNSANWQAALEHLHQTNNFPEFTGYTCPAPCETACTLSINTDAVCIKNIERAIVDTGWDKGWIVPQPPKAYGPYTVAVVGSGPCGLAAAQQLNRAGHKVTVFERDDKLGGLMVYGIPDFKFEKYQVQRRVQQLSLEGIVFKTSQRIGVDITLAQLQQQYNAVCLCIGGQRHSEINIDGRQSDGIGLGLPYLIHANKVNAGVTVDPGKNAKGRTVLVLGGGDTGADCVATATRQGAVKVMQVDINAKRPSQRQADNPWPQAPLVFQRSYAQQEGCTDIYGFEVLNFQTDAQGRVSGVMGQDVSWQYTSSRKRLAKKIGDKKVIAADMVLIAVGFSGAETQDFSSNEPQINALGSIKQNARMQTNLPGVFVAGDAAMGQSLVVWAIGEGRDVARQVDIYLRGCSSLPASIRTRNSPLAWRQH